MRLSVRHSASFSKKSRFFAQNCPQTARRAVLEYRNTFSITRLVFVKVGPGIVEGAGGGCLVLSAEFDAVGEAFSRIQRVLKSIQVRESRVRPAAGAALRSGVSMLGLIPGWHQ